MFTAATASSSREDSDSDFGESLSTDTKVNRKRKRPRTEAPRTTLRDLLGLTIVDDFIETGAEHEGDWSIAASPASRRDVIIDVPQSPHDGTASSEDELVLPTTIVTVSSATSRAEEPGFKMYVDHSDQDETLLEEFSLTLGNASQQDATCPHKVYHVALDNSMLRKERIVREAEGEEDGDGEEPLLRLESGATNLTVARPLREQQGSVVFEGQRPAFPVPAESFVVGPLSLAPGISVPSSINKFLRTYQQEGVRFLWRSYLQSRGTLLGDDMGLGKTIQVIAFLAAIMRKTGHENDADLRIEAERNDRLRADYSKANQVWPTCLIICPSTVIDNWRHELDTWGYFEHAAYTGARGKESLDNFKRGRLDILVTSHETASMAIEQLSSLDWSCIFIDEAHKLKNPASQMTMAMHKFTCKARFALTGTAIQNTYRELYTLADWTNPGLLGTVKEWKREIEEPLKQGQRKDATEEELANSRTRAEKLVQNVLPLFFLRRTKDLIKDQLPRKFDKVVFCPMTPTQLEVYRRILDEPEVDLMKRHAEPCQCGRLDPETGLPYRRQNCCFKRDSTGEPWNKNMLKYISLLQKCSNHVALVFPEPEDGLAKDADRVERYRRQLSYVKLMFPTDWADRRCNAANGMDEKLCGKWKVLSDLLKTWYSQSDKVLLFSTNLRLLQFIEYFVANQGFPFLRLDGSTPQHRRQQLVNKFNRDPTIFLFLISTTAGGTGLNLTAANRVVVFDPHWNPSHDLQAMDRAYRFGQTRDVHVYRLIGAGSLEECIYGRQLYKQQQMEIGYTAAKERRYFEGVAGDQQNLGELFGCKNLFTLYETSSTMKAIIDECNVSDMTFALQRYLEETASTDSAKTDLAQSGKADADGPGSDMLTNTAQIDPVSLILSEAGVQHVHEHTSLTGGSSAEAHRSRKAQTRMKRPRKPLKKGISATPSKSSLTQVTKWPPARPKPEEDTCVSFSSDKVAIQSSQERLEQLDRSLNWSGGKTRTPSLKELASIDGKTEAEFAAFVQRLSPEAQTHFFANTIDRWSSSTPSDVAR